MVVPLFSVLLMLTVKLFVCVGCIEMISAWT